MKEFKRSELSGRYTTKILYGWDDKKFKNKHLKKLKKNWGRWKRKNNVRSCEYWTIFYFPFFIFISFLFKS